MYTLTALEARLCCCGCQESREVLLGSRPGCWRRSMDAEEWGHRTDADAVGDFMFLPRLFVLLSLRWYSIGDWSAAAEKRCRTHSNALNSHNKCVFFLRKHWDLVPLRKFLWVSKIWTTSLNHARFISGDDAFMTKRVTLRSVPREVSTKQQGSSSECSSTPKQLTWITQETFFNIKNS